MIKRIILLIIVFINSHVVYALIKNKEQPIYYFVNHERQIDNLRKRLITNKIVITNIGKSKIAEEYVEEYKQDYDIVAFLDASIDLIPQFINIAKKINQQLGLQDGCYVAEDPILVKKSLMKYLKFKNKWLLIFDNLHVSESDKVEDIINWQHSGHIIICLQDVKYLQQKALVPYLNDQYAKIVVKKVVKDPLLSFIEKAMQALQSCSSYIMRYSATYPYSHVAMEHIDYIRKHNAKVQVLHIILGQISQQEKDILYKIALLNNQEVTGNLLEQLVDNQAIIADNINTIIRFGLVEQISKDRNKQIFRMPDTVKKKLLNISNTLNQKYINSLLSKINNIVPKSVDDRIFVITQNKSLESNLEILLNNAEQYNADVYKIMELREKLLWYYLVGHQPHNAKKMVDWFKNNMSAINLWLCSNRKKAVYSCYLTYVGAYEYFVANQPVEIAMRYLNQAQEITEKIIGYGELKSFIYSCKAIVQINIGDIASAIVNVQKAEKIKPMIPKAFLGERLVDHVRAQIFLIKGQYQEALDILPIHACKSERLFCEKDMLLLPEYITQTRTLNYIKRFKEAYDIVNSNIYEHIKNKKVPAIILAYTLIELSRAELGLGNRENALNHAIKAVNVLIEDTYGNDKNINLDDSKDAWLADALVAKADALTAIGKSVKAIKTYRTVKSIYENAYGIENMKNIDNVSYLFVQAAKAASKLPQEEDRQIWCSYFYKLFIQSFGRDHFRYQEIRRLFD